MEVIDLGIVRLTTTVADVGSTAGCRVLPRQAEPTAPVRGRDAGRDVVDVLMTDHREVEAIFVELESRHGTPSTGGSSPTW